MTAENLQTIREAVTAGGDSIVVLIVPPGNAGQLFGNPTTATPREERDLSIAQYKAQVEPDLSESRIRELCAEGVFPDTTDEAGEVVPGAYKDSAKEWRITREGIAARQKKEREEGLRRRAEEKAAKAARAEGDAREPQTHGVKNGRSREQTGSPPTGSRAARPH